MQWRQYILHLKIPASSCPSYKTNTETKYGKMHWYKSSSQQTVRTLNNMQWQIRVAQKKVFGKSRQLLFSQSRTQGQICVSTSVNDLIVWYNSLVSHLTISVRRYTWLIIIDKFGISSNEVLYSYLMAIFTAMLSLNNRKW